MIRIIGNRSQLKLSAYKLTADDLQSIEAILLAGIVSSTRYQEMFMNTLGGK